MNIGWFTYAPELQGVEKSSAGNAGWTRFVFEMYKNEGHNIIWLGEGQAPELTESPGRITIDVAIFNWRWSMPDYPERDKLYYKQVELLDALHRMDVKCIVHDQDHMISKEDLAYLKKLKVSLYAPELNPRDGFKQLFYPLNPNTQRYSLRNKMPFMSLCDLCYVGNVYGRYDQAVKFLKEISQLYRVEIYGNWLEKGPDRPGQFIVKKDLPYVYFSDRVSQKNVIEKLAAATATIHLFKPSYGKTGFITGRWIEAMCASTLAFVPSDFYLPPHIKEAWSKLGLIIDNGNELLLKYSTMSEANWASGVLSQRILVENLSDPHQWLDILED